MLDDLKRIAELDKSDAFGVAEKQVSQLEWKFDVVVEPNAEVRNVVLAGMGGSALYAEIYKSWPGAKLPFEIVRGYDIPPYVNQNTLFISSSFSGNTEETLEALSKAEERGATIAVIAAGGKLSEIAKEKNYPFAQLDATIPQPRMSAFNAFKALLTILEAAGVEEGGVAELETTGRRLADLGSQFRVDIPTSQNLAKQIALELMGRSVVVYSGPKLFPVANKWKINTNENAKNVAWVNYFPEQNHNEFIGWASHPIDKPYALINLLSDFEHGRVQKRFEVQDKLLSGRRPQPQNIHMKGESLLEQILYGVILGDFVSLYLGILNGLDPSPVELVERLKKELVS
jgi:glucose/mannose-6-phosphate isomerase